jgi:hypothetical protein
MASQPHRPAQNVGRITSVSWPGGLRRQYIRMANRQAQAVVIAVEEPAFPMAVQRVVGGVEVENDLLGRPCMRLEEEVEEQGLDRHRVMADSVIARGERTGEFEPIERRLASGRRAIQAPNFELARQRRHQRVPAKLVMVVEVFVAERDGENTLRDERADAMFDETRRPPVPKPASKPVDDPDGAIGRSQKQAVRVRGDRAAIEIGRHAPPPDRPKQIASLRANRSSKTTFADSEPHAPTSVRYPG